MDIKTVDASHSLQSSSELRRRVVEEDGSAIRTVVRVNASEVLLSPRSVVKAIVLGSWVHLVGIEHSKRTTIERRGSI